MQLGWEKAAMAISKKYLALSRKKRDDAQGSQRQFFVLPSFLRRMTRNSDLFKLLLIKLAHLK